jgi:hypothetical protein
METPATNTSSEEERFTSFYHKSASLGVWTVAIQFVAGVLLSPLVRQLAKEGMRWVYYTHGIINTVLFLICTICGTVALVGMVKHGRARLLWKGLVSLLPAMGFLAAVLLARK